jgi:predicted ATPase/transcriptional regulator with XRE-family HTH domain
MMDTFGEWLRQQRKIRKLTQRELANRVGCSIIMLRKIENGERRPSAQIAKLIANVLEIPPPELSTFVRVARGELRVERISHLSNLTENPNISPTQPAETPHNNLPVLPTPLIGRVYELKELNRLLNDPDCGLLTLVGPGGIGKTRLGIETASTMQDKFEDGIYFVPLAPVNFSRFIIPVIADSVGFSFQSKNPADPKTQLFSYLSEKHMLLLIDNIEHLLKEPDIQFFPELLAIAPKVKLLFTSREPLDLQVEWVYEVQGLPVPEDEQTNTTTQGTSIELFIQRARRANARFSATTDDLPTIVRICELVDGMPLAIELAAGWVRALSCDEIAYEIECGLDILHTSARDLPARHRSMRAVFDHSWKLLTEEEQPILCRLSVFQGGFSREAAGQVAGATLSDLSKLITKSLIRRSSTGRYDLHELIRQYIFEKLVNQHEVQKEAEARHGQYFLKYLSREDMRLRSSTQQEALVEVTAEIDNIREALEWALDHHEFTLIEESLRAYTTFYDTLGWAQEALDYLGRVRDALETKSSISKSEQVALAHVLTCRSLFAYRTSQSEEANIMLDHSFEILRPLNKPGILVEALTFLGIIRLTAGELVEALELFKEGLQVATDHDDQWYAALCLTEIVDVNMFLGEASNDLEQFHSVVEAWRKTGDPRFTAFGLNCLSLGAIAVGKYEEARAASEESIAINRLVGDRWGLGVSYRGLGLVAQAHDEHAMALDSLRRSLQIFTELGSHWDVARTLSDIAQSTFAIGNDYEARNLWRESLRLAMDTQGLLAAIDAIVGIAGMETKEGNNQQALELVTVVLNHPAATQEARNRAQVLQGILASQLAPKQFETIQSLVKNRSFQSIVDDML